MRNESFKTSIQLKIKESVQIESTDLIITLINASRLRPPRMPDQFMIQLEFQQGNIKETKGIDGEFRFPSDNVSILWKNFEIKIIDMDFMATGVSLCVRTLH